MTDYTASWIIVGVCTVILGLLLIRSISRRRRSARTQEEIRRIFLEAATQAPLLGIQAREFTPSYGHATGVRTVKPYTRKASSAQARSAARVQGLTQPYYPDPRPLAEPLMETLPDLADMWRQHAESSGPTQTFSAPDPSPNCDSYGSSSESSSYSSSSCDSGSSDSGSSGGDGGGGGGD
jgi:hypothetical protein